MRSPFTREVGTCSHCAGAVLLRVTRQGLLTARDASCGCGATVIRPAFFVGLGRGFVTAVRR